MSKPDVGVNSWMPSQPPEDLLGKPADVLPRLTRTTLRHLFLCCHPDLQPASQVTLTLRAVGGLTTAEIARALLTPETTVGSADHRAKQKLQQSGAASGFPRATTGGKRLDVVMQVLYLIFNEGYAASSGTTLQRVELAVEAIRLTGSCCRSCRRNPRFPACWP